MSAADTIMAVEGIACEGATCCTQQRQMVSQLLSTQPSCWCYATSLLDNVLERLDVPIFVHVQVAGRSCRLIKTVSAQRLVTLRPPMLQTCTCTWHAQHSNGCLTAE